MVRKHSSSITWLSQLVSLFFAWARKRSTVACLAVTRSAAVRGRDDARVIAGQGTLAVELVEQAPDTLPDPARFSDWRTFLLHEVEESVKAVKTKHTLSRVDDLAWGTVNRVRMAHPLSEAIPVVGTWLNMADDAASGCGPCVRVLNGSLTASERMVVSPAHHTDALFHMPGGQSGHPLSPHYRDQQANWSQGRSTPLLAGKQHHTLTFTPEGSAARL